MRLQFSIAELIMVTAAICVVTTVVGWYLESEGVRYLLGLDEPAAVRSEK